MMSMVRGRLRDGARWMGMWGGVIVACLVVFEVLFAMAARYPTTWDWASFAMAVTAGGLRVLFWAVVLRSVVYGARMAGHWVGAKCVEGLVPLFLTLVFLDLMLFGTSGFHYTFFRWNMTRKGVGPMLDIVAGAGIGLSTFLMIGGLLAAAWLAPLAVAIAMPRWRKAGLTRRQALVGVAVGALGGAVLMGGAWAEQSLSRTLKSQTLWAVEQGASPLYLRLERSKPSLWSRPIVPPKRFGKEDDERFVEMTTWGSGANPPPVLMVIQIESVRADHVTSELMPNLLAFGAENPTARYSMSNSNATGYSWYSIVTGRSPVYFHQDYATEELEGSVALRMLRRLGYQVHTVSSADLGFMGTRRLIFGNRDDLTDVRLNNKTMNPARGDQEVVRVLGELLPEFRKGERHAVLVFLKSSHHTYHWPESFGTRFKPVTDKINYLSMRLFDSELEKVKNRYRNAVHHTDHCLGEIFALLKRQGMYDSTALIVTSDHGEEFLEHGRFTHASQLVSQQIDAPMFVRMPGRRAPEGLATMSLTQIMPTLLDGIGAEFPRGAFSGPSIYWAEAMTNDQLTMSNANYRLPVRYAVVSSGVKYMFDVRRNEDGHGYSAYFVYATDMRDEPYQVPVGMTPERLASEALDRFERVYRRGG